MVIGPIAELPYRPLASGGLTGREGGLTVSLLVRRVRGASLAARLRGARARPAGHEADGEPAAAPCRGLAERRVWVRKGRLLDKDGDGIGRVTMRLSAPRPGPGTYRNVVRSGPAPALARTTATARCRRCGGGTTRTSRPHVPTSVTSPRPPGTSRGGPRPAHVGSRGVPHTSDKRWNSSIATPPPCSRRPPWPSRWWAFRPPPPRCGAAPQHAPLANHLVSPLSIAGKSNGTVFVSQNLN